MNLMIVPGILVCSRFLISVYMFIVSKAFPISSATVIVRSGGAIWLNPFLRCCLMCVVTSLYSVVFCTRVPWVCYICLLLCKEEGSSPVYLQLLKGGDMGLYEVTLALSLLGIGMETMLANLHMCGIMLVLRAVFNMLVRNASLVF